MTDVPDCTVLVRKTSVHFLSNILFILVELSESVVLDALYLVSLPFQLVFKFVHEVLLLLLSLLSFCLNGFFDFASVFSQVLQNFAFFCDSGVLLSLEVGEFLVHALVHRLELVIQTLDAVRPLSCKFVLQELHASVSAFVFV